MQCFKWDHSDWILANSKYCRYHQTVLCQSILEIYIGHFAYAVGCIRTIDTEFKRYSMSKMGLTDFHLSHNSRWHIYFWTCRLWERYVILIQGNFQEDLITYADTALPLLQFINCWRQSLSWCALVTFFFITGSLIGRMPVWLISTIEAFGHLFLMCFCQCLPLYYHYWFFSCICQFLSDKILLSGRVYYRTLYRLFLHLMNDK
jgi:hypothetical protein